MADDRYALDPAARALLVDLDVDPIHVLRRAGLPADLWSRAPVRLSEDDYFALWSALEEEAADPNLPIRIAQVLSPEVFDPPLFAALASPNLNVAAQRIATYKKLVGPVDLDVDIGPSETTLRYRWPTRIGPPPVLVLSELLFWIALARIATRHRVRPSRITTPDPPADQDAYRNYTGVRIESRPEQSISFGAVDAARPFLVANDDMWALFEPGLKKRLAELEHDATWADRVKAALLELLPTGRATMRDVSHQLGTSTRTLHRRLQAEGTTFQAVLDSTRESLARHYLASPALSTTDIAFLLGYEEPSSFHRAFHNWTGQAPQHLRATTN